MSNKYRNNPNMIDDVIFITFLITAIIVVVIGNWMTTDIIANAPTF
jgi:hypothetical protein